MSMGTLPVKVTAADNDRDAVRQTPHRHRVHRAVVAGDRQPGRAAVGGTWVSEYSLTVP
jgi:hypothetical protein